MSRRFAFRVQAFLVDIVFGLLALLRPRHASQIGGVLLAALGPVFKAQNKRVRRHLALALPGKTDEERDSIRREMWRHLGMVLGEYPHLGRFVDGHPDFKLEIKGLEHFHHVQGEPLLFVSGHIGNWEILPIVCKELGVPFHPLYRGPNNPFVDAKLARMREAGGRLLPGFPKSRKGLKAMTETLRQGGTVGMLVDQRHSGGPDLEFFGRNVQTATLAADVAQKYGATIMAGRIVRKGPCDFLFETRPSFQSENRDPLNLMQEIYCQLETWIQEHPEQWLWTHQRWGKNL